MILDTSISWMKNFRSCAHFYADASFCFHMKSNLVSDRLPGFRPAPPRSVTLTAYGPDSVVEVLRVAIGAQGSVIGVYNERKDAQSNLWRSLRASFLQRPQV